MNIKFTLWLLVICLLTRNAIADIQSFNINKIYEFPEEGYYRKVIKQENGAYIIKNYYLDNSSKFTDEYKILSSSDLNKPIEQQTSIDGLYIQYKKNGDFIWMKYKNGRKRGYQEYKKDGIADGQGIIWFPNGKISMITNTKNKKMHGNTIAWRQDGTMQATAYYVNNRKNGLWQSWHINGCPSSIINFDLDDIESCQEWNEDGTEVYRGKNREKCLNLYHKFYLVKLDSEPPIPDE